MIPAQQHTQRAQFDRSNFSGPAVKESQPSPDVFVGHTAHADAQWLADLATLERIEEQSLYPDPCFFTAMGEIQNERLEGRIA